MRKINDISKKLLVLGIVALWAFAMYIFKIPCPIYSVFHIPCLGCGMTRAVVSLLKLRFADALSHHLMVASLPVLVLCFLYDGMLFKSKTANTLLYITIACGFILNYLLHIMY